jgi:hypothetical protein
MKAELWREDGSAICSAIIQWSESRRTRNQTLFVFIWDSKSKLLYDWRSVSQNVLVSSTLEGLATRYYFLSECFCLKFAVFFLWERPLWREEGSAICRVITLWSESLKTRNYTLLSHLRLPETGGLGSRIYILQEQGASARAGAVPGHWVLMMMSFNMSTCEPETSCQVAQL